MVYRLYHDVCRHTFYVPSEWEYIELHNTSSFICVIIYGLMFMTTYVVFIICRYSFSKRSLTYQSLSQTPFPKFYFTLFIIEVCCTVNHLKTVVILWVSFIGNLCIFEKGLVMRSVGVWHLKSLMFCRLRSL